MSASQTSEEKDFLAGFANATDESPAAPAAEEPRKQAEAEQAPKQEQAEQPAESAETPKEEPQRFAGFTEDELKNLLARAAKVDELETGLRKAHGKIGELNSKLQEVAKAPAPAQKSESEQMDLSHVEEDYPDIARWVRSQLGQKEPAEEVQPQAQQPEPAQQQGASAELIQLALMDHLHKGWREKVQSQEFNLWLAASGDDVRNAYQTAATAEALGGVLGGYDAWQAKKGQRSQAGNQRLEQAMTPQGSAGKPKTTPSSEDAFIAGFKSVYAR
jgi:hypothetical protein